MFKLDARILLGTVAVWGALGFLCRFFTPETPLGARWGQWAFWLVFLLLLVSLRPIAAFLRGLPRAHAVILASVFTLLLGAQLLDRSSDTFPFVSWRMFSSPAPASVGPMAFYECYGRTESGDRVRLNPPRLVPPLKNYRMTVGLMQQVDGALAARRPDSDAGRRLSRTLRAVGKIYNRENPPTPIRAVEVFRCQMDPRDPGTRRSPYRWLVWSAEISGEGSP